MDKTVVQKIKERWPMVGMNEGFAEIYGKYFNDIFRYVYHRISDLQVAEDVTQETFYAALEKGDDFLEHPYPKRWLLCTARYKVYELYRKMKNWSMVPLEGDYPELAKEEFGYVQKELELMAQSVLSEEDWGLFRNYHLLGCTIAELAQLYGITEANTRVRLTRLKQKLRGRLKD